MNSLSCRSRNLMFCSSRWGSNEWKHALNSGHLLTFSRSWLLVAPLMIILIISIKKPDDRLSDRCVPDAAARYSRCTRLSLERAEKNRIVFRSANCGVTKHEHLWKCLLIFFPRKFSSDWETGSKRSKIWRNNRNIWNLNSIKCSRRIHLNFTSTTFIKTSEQFVTDLWNFIRRPQSHGIRFRPLREAWLIFSSLLATNVSLIWCLCWNWGFAIVCLVLADRKAAEDARGSESCHTLR